MRNNNEKKEGPDAAKTVRDGSNQIQVYDLALAAGNMGAYQTKLIELTQANVQFAFDFSCRLATIRSPFHFVDVIVEFATRRADMLEKQATEMAALAKRATVLGSLTPRPDSSPH